jgi:hypothetical protein
MSYLSDIEKYARQACITDLCIAWNDEDELLLYLYTAEVWSENPYIADELIWLSFIYQAGRNL